MKNKKLFLMLFLASFRCVTRPATTSFGTIFVSIYAVSHNDTQTTTEIETNN